MYTVVTCKRSVGNIWVLILTAKVFPFFVVVVVLVVLVLVLVVAAVLTTERQKLQKQAVEALQK